MKRAGGSGCRPGEYTETRFLRVTTTPPLAATDSSRYVPVIESSRVEKRVGVPTAHHPVEKRPRTVKAGIDQITSYGAPTRVALWDPDEPINEEHGWGYVVQDLIGKPLKALVVPNVAQDHEIDDRHNRTVAHYSCAERGSRYQLTYSTARRECRQEHAYCNQNVCLDREVAQEAYDGNRHAPRSWVLGHQPKLKDETTQSNDACNKPKGPGHDQLFL